MSKTKSKVFRIEISENNDSTLTSQTEMLLNDFFSDPNYIYINHTSSVLTDSVGVMGKMKVYSKEILLVIIYKDLADTNYDLKKVSKRVREIVRSQIEDDSIIEEPDFLTEIDRKILALTKPMKGE